MTCGRKGCGRIICAAAAVVVLGLLQNSPAALTFSAGTVTLTQDSDVSTANPTYSSGSIPVPRSSEIYPAAPWQLENIFATGRSSTEAAGAQGRFTNSTTAAIVLAPGTGIMQYDPDGIYGGASSLKLNVDSTWNVVDTAYGPPGFNFGIITAGGEVGAGGSAILSINLMFTNQGGLGGGAPFVASRAFGPGTFSQTFTGSSFLGVGTGTLAAGSKLQITGTIELQAIGTLAPTTLNISRSEVGIAPPTAVFRANAQGGWFDSNNWEAVPANRPGWRSIANAVGDRALFYADQGPNSLRSITIDQPVTIGTLDVDGNTPHSFNAVGGGALTFATPQGNPVINLRTLAGASAINAPVTLTNTTEIITEGKSSLLIGGSIGGSGNITKMGSGKLILSGANTFIGNTTVREGTLMVSNETGSAVNGSVTFQFGSNSTLTGGGSIAGSVVLFQTSHLAPGNGVGTITVGGLSLAGGDLHIESDATGFDRINIVNPDRFVPASGAWIYPTDRGGTKEGDYVIIDYSGAPLADSSLLGNLKIWTGGDEGLFVYSLIHDRDNTNVVLHVTKTGLQEWNVDANSNFGNPNAWVGGIPGATSRANFLGKITAPRTVTLNSAWSVSGVNFDNLNAYTLAPGTSGKLTVGTPSQGGRINVLSGSHAILAPVTIAADTSINIAPGSALNLGGGLTIDPNDSIDVAGGGTLSIGGPQIPAVGATLNVSNGRVNLNSNANAAASANGANLLLNLSGNDNNTPSSIVLGASQHLKALNVDYAADGTQSFDFGSPPAAGAFWQVNVYATNLNVAKAALYKAIVNANGPGAVDRHDGIFDSGLHDNSAIGIAIQATSNVVIMRPTRIGDANLDSSVTISDFNILMAHFDQKDTATWQEGDFNYDGDVTIEDFLLLGANFNVSYDGRARATTPQDLQTLQAFAAAHGVSVPEPTVALLMVMTVGALGRSRSRSPRLP